jgi:hypothetical protein
MAVREVQEALRVPVILLVHQGQLVVPEEAVVV